MRFLSALARVVASGLSLAATASFAFADPVVPPLEGGKRYVGCGDTFFIDGCGGTDDAAYCMVIYPTRPKPSGIMVQKAEQRGTIIKRLQACGQLPGGGGRGGGAQASHVAPPAPVAKTVSTPRAVPKNYCDGGKETNWCVACTGHDCELERVTSTKATGVTTFNMRMVVVTAKVDPRKLSLNTIEEDSLEEYYATYDALPLKAQDPAQTCDVDVHEIGRDLTPEEAASVMKDQVGKSQKDKQVLGQRPISFEGYPGTLWGDADAKTTYYTVHFLLIYHDVGVDQVCRYSARQDSTNEPHWAAINLSFGRKKPKS
jgi:hypothetical protein